MQDLANAGQIYKLYAFPILDLRVEPIMTYEILT